jgi:NitT/TauT family transport system ATP-binding protein
VSQPDSDAVVVARDVCLAYPNAQGRWFVAVQGATFHVRRGEKLVIIGPSGCGKTTLLKAIAGFLRPVSGQILVEGRPIKKPGPDRAVVFQDFDQLFAWRTVHDNITYALAVARGIRGQEATNRARHFLDLVGIGAAGSRYPHMLSGGMKQRAALARALALEPSILLMDEPFGALDAITRSQLQLELNEIWKRTGVTIILVTHSIPEAIFLGHHVMVMTPAPAIIREIVDTSAAENFESPEFAAFSNRLRALLVTGEAREAALQTNAVT